MTVSQGDSLRVDDSMVKAAIERKDYLSAQTFIMAQQLEALRVIAASLASRSIEIREFNVVNHA